MQQLTPMDRELRAESMLEHQLSNFSSNSKVTAAVPDSFLPLEPKVLFEA